VAVDPSALRVTPARRITGAVRPPGDKSVTHRCLLFGALATAGPTAIYNPLRSEDCLATIECLTELGADIEHFEAEEFGGRPCTIVMPGPWTSPDIPLDCGNSGTTMRLLAGAIASVDGLRATLVGDASLSRRPMGRIADPIRRMGAWIEGETPPLTIEGRALAGIRHASPVASAQVKSCVLLAGLRATGETWVTEPSPSRDHTERLLEALGVELMRDGETTVGLRGGQSWLGFETDVPGDVSSAAFFMVAAACLAGSEVRLAGVGLNPTRTGVLDVLEAAGASVAVENLYESGGEPIGDVVVRGGAGLKAIEVSEALVPRLVDEVPVLAVLATQCRGTSAFRDCGELRVKESDRLEAVAGGLEAMGATVRRLEDGFEIDGPTRLRGATIEADGDHRIAMAFAVAGLLAEDETVVLGAESIATSYPGFAMDLAMAREG
jgi:3-phosphoshikimate 1-carboxyvinyltransferase